MCVCVCVCCVCVCVVCVCNEFQFPKLSSLLIFTFDNSMSMCCLLLRKLKMKMLMVAALLLLMQFKALHSFFPHSSLNRRCIGYKPNIAPSTPFSIQVRHFSWPISQTKIREFTSVPPQNRAREIADPLLRLQNANITRPSTAHSREQFETGTSSKEQMRVFEEVRQPVGKRIRERLRKKLLRKHNVTSGKLVSKRNTMTK